VKQLTPTNATAGWSIFYVFNTIGNLMSTKDKINLQYVSRYNLHLTSQF